MQPPRVPQVTKGGATKKTILSKSLQIGDIVEYSRRLEFTHPRDLMGEIIKMCWVDINIRLIGGGDMVRWNKNNVTIIHHKQQEGTQAKMNLNPFTVTVVEMTSPKAIKNQVDTTNKS